jgi:hypothetical protein
MINNMRAVSAPGRQEMARHFAETKPNLVILDLCPGKEDGLAQLGGVRPAAAPAPLGFY